MSKFTHEQKEQLVFILSYIVAGVSIIAALALVGLEAYVRWVINKEFTFLGQNSLGALILGSFGLLAALLFVHRTHKN